MKKVIGTQYNFWTILKRIAYRSGQTIVLARCICGTEKEVGLGNLRGGKSQSCGCQFNQRARIHLMSKTPTYASWAHIISRCHRPGDPSFKHYGAKGIKVCDHWRYSFASFFKDMGIRPDGTTLTRIDQTKNFSKENCKWVLKSEVHHGRLPAPEDEFTNLSVSKQRRWQLRRQKQRRCVICGETAINKTHCEYHRIQNNVQIHLRKVKGQK